MVTHRLPRIEDGAALVTTKFVDGHRILLNQHRCKQRPASARPRPTRPPVDGAHANDLAASPISTTLVLYEGGDALLRIARLTDYAIVLLARLANAEGEGVLAAAELAAASQLPYPTVSKILKRLSRAGLVLSLRGFEGGYRLARPADRVSVAEIIAAIEGPIALTECSADAPGLCDLEPVCPVRSNWQRINATVRGALEHLTLEEMTRPLSRAAVSRLTLIRSNKR